MKKGNDKVLKNKFKYSTIKNLKESLILNIKKNNSPKYSINNNIIGNSFIKKNNSNRKRVSKFSNNYEGSIYNINSLLDKMNSLKKLMYHPVDSRAMLVMDKYGLRYSSDLRKNINSAKKLMNCQNSPSPHSKKNFDSENKKSIRNSRDFNYFKAINLQNNFKRNNKSKKTDNKIKNLNKEFDLTNIQNISKPKKEIMQNLLEEQKKENKLYHLKTELFLREQKYKLRDPYIFEEKLKNNVTFIRDDINFNKDKYYSQIKSKYKRKKIKRNKDKHKNNLINIYKTNNFIKLSKDKFNWKKSNIINMKINENKTDSNNSENEENIKYNQKIIYFKDRINSYNSKIKIHKSNKSVNNDIFITYSANKNQKQYILKEHLPTSPNLTMYKNRKDKKSRTSLNKISIAHVTTTNNSQENTSLNSMNSSIITNDIIHPKYKNSLKILKNNFIQKYSLISKNKNNFSKISLNKSKKASFENNINNIMNKSNKIKNNIMNISEESKKIKNTLFSKHNYNNNLKTEINIDKINEYFKFSRRQGINEDKIIRGNAEKVKATMDKRCSNLLDNIVNELHFKDRRLNKEYLELSEYEKQILKIKRENILKKLSNEQVLLEKEIEKDKIFDVFLPENEEIINMIKEDKDCIKETIEQLYEKTKILKQP